MPFGKPFIQSIAMTFSLFLVSTLTWGQQISRLDRELVEAMLKNVSGDLKKHYYDAKLHSLDWDAKAAETEDKIDKATSLNMAMSHLAASLDVFDDSHTFFLPPPRPYHHDYGWRAQMIGDHCYVIRIRPKTDAESKGLHPGDEILGINGYAPNRDNYWKMEYVYNTLRPQPGLRLNLRAPAGEERQLDIAAKNIQTKRIADLTGADGGADVWGHHPPKRKRGARDAGALRGIGR